jgi:hypothetical protein
MTQIVARLGFSRRVAQKIRPCPGCGAIAMTQIVARLGFSRRGGPKDPTLPRLRRHRDDPNRGPVRIAASGRASRPERAPPPAPVATCVRLYRRLRVRRRPRQSGPRRILLLVRRRRRSRRLAPHQRLPRLG